MTAYLAYYREFWNCLLEPGEHRHEVGEDRGGCYNCQLEEAAQRMSEFESVCWRWYMDNVNPFAMQAGIVGEMFKGESLAGAVKAMFLEALNKIHQALEFIQAEMQAKQREAVNG